MKKILILLVSLLSSQFSHSQECFTFSEIEGYASESGYSANIILSRISDQKIYEIPQFDSNGFDLSINIFDDLANLTNSFNNYPELAYNDIKNLEYADRVNGEIIIDGEENFKICTNSYEVNDNFILFSAYEILPVTKMVTSLKK